jgi:small subunit ribosomal protein S18
MTDQEQPVQNNNAPAPAAAPEQRAERPERRAGPRSGPRPERRGPGGKFAPRPKVCQFCVEKTKKIDYKSPEQLRRFVSDRGKIRPRRQTGTCARHQRHLAIAIKRARHLALLPFVGTQAR